MVKNILILLTALVLILVVVIAIQPSTFAIERSTEIAAPPEVVFPHLDGAKALDVWSPWNKMDPKMTITHEGPETGVGSSESWEGPEMGKGRLTITDVKPNEAVEIKLEFVKPMEITNRALFTLSPTGTGTRVAWRMEGTHDFMGKAASLVMNMDERVGGTFERGLADLGALAEADARKQQEAEQAAAAAAAMDAGETTEASPDVGAPPAEAPPSPAAP